ncbi:hypothetical protein TVAG_101220 [Trichomonas vaginalis G3]|uniref:CCR4-NOT transcription complex subunit 10 n=1 Tax=Trichomonas vaginalis (strain ATCC PRA-98 / G3) TaxID=412133 RepID=A2DJK4_TRIV3|nr:regulation of translation [Trichomonas vaginalis G3]EAY19404.1 hypothetical protein TVAG_101220 [Trichomonas vaginalis G3]KAI5493198.1 regulation of translation [Trichomonas vaginalis G3]|eukprot:XP_001580390.1 hypothetical protein [Trichomonas vaginalis G3]
MSADREVFYQEKYKQLIEKYEKIPNQSISVQHNLAILHYLVDGTNPFPTFMDITKKIQVECDSNNLWLIHPSWALVNYHIALFYYQRCQYENCSYILSSIWLHADFVDDLTMLFVSLLSIDLVRTVNDWKFFDKARAFLAEKVIKGEPVPALKQLLVKHFGDTPRCHIVEDQIKNVSMQVKIAKYITSSDEQSKNDVQKLLLQYTNQKSLSIHQAFPLLSAAVYVNNNAAYGKVLDLIQNQFQTDTSIINNRGVYDILKEKYSSALLYFSNALNTRSNDEVTNPYHQVLYNIGLSLLFKQKPRKAFEVFHSLIPVIPKFPYLWLRLAECCVMYYKKHVSKLRAKTQISPVIARRFSTPTRSFTILPASNAKIYNRFRDTKNGIFEDLNLEFAQRCALNAVHLSDKKSQLLISALLICTFVSLEMSEWEQAANYVKEIISNTDADSAIKFTARVYGAQALCMLHDKEKAIEYLRTQILEVAIGQSKKSIMFYLTYAQLYILNQDYESARAYLSKVTEQGQNVPEYVITSVQYSLKKGDTNDGLRVLSEFTQKEDD